MPALSERTRDDPLNPRIIVDNQNPPRRHVRALERIIRRARICVRATTSGRRSTLATRRPSCVPAPVAPLALLGLGAGRPLLFGTLAARRALAGTAARRTPAPRVRSPRAGNRPARAADRSRGVDRLDRRRADRGLRQSHPDPGPPGPGRLGQPPAAEEPNPPPPPGAPGAASPEAAGRAGPGRFGLRLFDDDRPPLQDAAGQLLDRSLGAVVGHGFDEGEPSWTAGFAIERRRGRSAARSARR